MSEKESKGFEERNDSIKTKGKDIYEDDKKKALGTYERGGTWAPTEKHQPHRKGMEKVVVTRKEDTLSERLVRTRTERRVIPRVSA